MNTVQNKSLLATRFPGIGTTTKVAKGSLAPADIRLLNLSDDSSVPGYAAFELLKCLGVKATTKTMMERYVAPEERVKAMGLDRRDSHRIFWMITAEGMRQLLTGIGTPDALHLMAYLDEGLDSDAFALLSVLPALYKNGDISGLCLIDF